MSHDAFTPAQKERSGMFENLKLAACSKASSAIPLWAPQYVCDRRMHMQTGKRLLLFGIPHHRAADILTTLFKDRHRRLLLTHAVFSCCSVY